MPEQRDDQCQSHGRFGRGDGHDEERDDLPVDASPVPPRGHERQVHRVQHDLDGQEHGDQVAAQEHAGRPNREEQAGEEQIVVQRDHEDAPPRLASTTAPTMATRMRIDVASNANTCSRKRPVPIRATELTDSASGSCPNGLTPTPRRASRISIPNTMARTAPTRRPVGPTSVATGTASACSRGTFSSMTTKRNSTMMAPA